MQNDPAGKKGLGHITTESENILVLIRFRIAGGLRFLSHAETVRVFQRACVRAGLEIEYSGGFNPRPRLSLPLPRSVGIETDDDLLCIKIKPPSLGFDSERFLAGLARCLPQDCELLSVQTATGKTNVEARLAEYVLSVRPGYEIRELTRRIERLLASDSLELQRKVDAKGTVRTVDVRQYLESIQAKGGNIVVRCRVSAAGSIRVEEILRLLELDEGQLAGPIRRTSVQWRQHSKN
ncbi:MAG: TIGR03936 family radical SAM-associated protein [Planctomycetota bacterium]